MNANGSRGVILARLGIILLVLVGMYFFRDVWLAIRYYQPETASPLPLPTQHAFSNDGAGLNNDQIQGFDTQSSTRACINAPGGDKVMVILKTGATVIYEKLPLHFSTTFRCIPPSNLFLASDLEQSFAGHRVFDAIAAITKQYRDNHPDFELYRTIQRYQQEGRDLSSLKGELSWELDKWKFLPMLHQAFETAGDEIEWFVIIEADTSLSWTNLLQWLQRMDSKQPLYLGAQNHVGSTAFAHGGSGIVLSREAANVLEEYRQIEGKADYDARWEDDLVNNCCGDEIIARALLEAGIELTPAWPPIQGETPSTLDWTDRHWCAPPISWHHVSPSELDALWQFERAWVDGHGWNEPYLFRDVFVHFIEEHISQNRTRWNNMSKDQKFATGNMATADDKDWLEMAEDERLATESAENCAKACIHPLHKDKCMQWQWSPGRCHLGYAIQFGMADERADGYWTSGWITQNIEQFKYKHHGCQVNWLGEGAEP